MNSKQLQALPSESSILVWDLPTRIFHWAFAASVIGALACALIGGDAMAWHMRFGYAALTLAAFRLLWGFVGPRYARFASFPPRPFIALRYLRSGARDYFTGHNPAGALSVYAILGSVSLQAITGLFANDDVLWSGPLSGLVSNAFVALATKLHHLNSNLIYLLLILHLGAIAFHTVIRHELLIKAMICGKRSSPSSASSTPEPSARDGLAVRLLALALLAACALMTWTIAAQG
jgi:cytochrome b